MPNRPKAIYCGGTGNIAAVGTDGVVATFAVTAGQFLDIRPVRINLTGTNAANIVAIY